jgi:cytochrome c-type biogenesis protein CcmE
LPIDPQNTGMKRTHIALLILVAAAVCVIVTSFADFSTYETFSSAARQPGKAFHVIGYMQVNKPMEYNPVKDPNHFIFYAHDKSGKEEKVIYNGEKPRDIEKSEQIVMTGVEDNGTFHCSSIQMKCPSKYKKDMVATGNSQQVY